MQAYLYTSSGGCLEYTARNGDKKAKDSHMHLHAKERYGSHASRKGQFNLASCSDSRYHGHRACYCCSTFHVDSWHCASSNVQSQLQSSRQVGSTGTHSGLEPERQWRSFAKLLLGDLINISEHPTTDLRIGPWSSRRQEQVCGPRTLSTMTGAANV